jgi:hypothetical protein
MFRCGLFIFPCQLSLCHHSIMILVSSKDWTMVLLLPLLQEIRSPHTTRIRTEVNCTFTNTHTHTPQTHTNTPQTHTHTHTHHKHTHTTNTQTPQKHTPQTHRHTTNTHKHTHHRHTHTYILVIPYCSVFKTVGISRSRTAIRWVKHWELI